MRNAFSTGFIFGLGLGAGILPGISLMMLAAQFLRRLIG